MKYYACGVDVSVPTVQGSLAARFERIPVVLITSVFATIDAIFDAVDGCRAL
jgi:hypothetical protein